MQRSIVTFLWLCATTMFITCSRKPASTPGASRAANDTVYRDTPFWQEYHDAYPVADGKEQLGVRSIAISDDGTVWICTARGAFYKVSGSREWKPVFAAADQGPAFDVIATEDGAVWIAMWNKVIRIKGRQHEEVSGLEAPVGVLASSAEGVYALGPKGAWKITASGSQALTYTVARSIRGARSDDRGGLWIGSDVGIYHGVGDSVAHTHDTTALLSAYVRAIEKDPQGRIWFGGLGGVSIYPPTPDSSTKSIDMPGQTIKLRPRDGLSSAQVNSITRSPDGAMWIGTDVGIVRYRDLTTHSLLFSRRWLLDDRVLDIAFDKEGTAWVATDAGVSAIRRKRMTLASKERYFYDVLMRRHIRDPWIAGQCKLPIAGDTSRWEGDDDDNDGEYTGNYLAMESFRFAATGDPDAKAKARKAFDFLRQLQEVTETDGFFARTIVPSSWTEIDDRNRKYTAHELAEEMVKEPRFKPVEVRWRRSRDGKWLWKGDTSSDEICGHMMGYFFYHELVADESEKAKIAAHVRKIVDHLIKNNYTLMDVDGTHTRWAVWSPDKLNRDSEWQPDRSLNSLELLSFLKFAYHVTHDEKYQQEYLRLIREEHYLDNFLNIPRQNPGWFIYFDVMLALYQYPILMKCEQDPELLNVYRKHLDQWFDMRRDDQNPQNNFFYSYARAKKEELNASVDFLIDTPLDLIDWKIDHTKREDISFQRAPILDEMQVNVLPPASIRATVRWDKNPWALNTGNPNMEREPVFWLLPYWMGRYLKMIE